MRMYILMHICVYIYGLYIEAGETAMNLLVTQIRHRWRYCMYNSAVKNRSQKINNRIHSGLQNESYYQENIFDPSNIYIRIMHHAHYIYAHIYIYI